MSQKKRSLLFIMFTMTSFGLQSSKASESSFSFHGYSVKKDDKVSLYQIWDLSDPKQLNDWFPYYKHFVKAQAGDSQSQCILGNYYYLGKQFIEDSEKIKVLYVYYLQTKVRGYYSTGRIPEEFKDYNQAIKWYELAAKQKHLEALWTLGECYELGRGVPQNYERALEKYKEAANENYAPALNSIGHINEFCLGFAEKKELTFDYYYRAASQDQGYVRSEYNVARHYYEGIGIDRDEEQAFLWLKKAIVKNYLPAQYYLNKIYWEKKLNYKNEQKFFQFYEMITEQEHKGLDFKNKENWEIYWYQKAAKQEYILAQFYLGYLYEYGQNNISQDEEQAVHWYQEAAEQGLAEAQFNLALMYQQDRIVRGDKKEASSLYLKAATQGHVQAQFNLGVMYDNGHGVEKNLKAAVHWYQEAAEQGLAEAQFNLALMYQQDRIVGGDKRKASSLYLKAATQGYAAAQLNLGIMYYTGQGVTEDKKVAADWFQKAADQGNPEAQYNLGVIYNKGQGVDQDYTKAFHWHQEAANQKYVPAQGQIGLLYYTGQGVTEDKKVAADWFQKAADQGHSESQYNLSVMYNKGQSIKKDKDKAVLYLEKAANQGYVKAQSSLAYEYAINGDLNTAIKWWKKAAKKNDVGSKYYLSLVDIFDSKQHNLDVEMVKYEHEYSKKYPLITGHGFYTSVDSLKQDLAKNDKDAQYLYGILRHFGIGFEQNFREAIRYRRYAAKQGHFKALLHLPNDYFAGEVVVKDIPEALKWRSYSLKHAGTTFFQINIDRLGNIPHHLKNVQWYCKLWEEVKSKSNLKMLKDSAESDISYEISPKRKTSLKNLKNQYDIFLFDIGGVIHDGINPFSEAVATINKLAQEKKVVFVSNSARPEDVVRKDLIKKGISPDLFEKEFRAGLLIDPKAYIIAAGDVVRQDLDKRYKDKKIYHFSFKDNKNEDILKGINNQLVDQPEDAELILLTQYIEKKEGWTDDQLFEEYEGYMESVAKHAIKGYPILCVNPDIEAFHGSTTIRYCAGAFAKRLIEKYKVPKEQIIYYGKPDQKIYHHMEKTILRNSQTFKNRMVMIGDTLDNDVLGAQKFGIDSLLVLTGNTAREIKELEAEEKDFWYFVAEYYKHKQAKPRYFMDSLTDEIQ